MAHLEAIFLLPVKGGAAVRHPSANAVAGRGLDGDHHQAPVTLFGLDHTPENQLTLIEAEALDALARKLGEPLPEGASRRNLVTRGVRLNALVGRTFRIGAVRARGIERCDPCLHLESMTRPGVLRGLVNRGGLRAEVLSDGVLHEGDPIAVE
jgi:MOSC domain-containing protein YiiM